MRAVRFDDYGPVEALDVREVDDPVPGDGEVLVRVRAAAINPGEAAIREGALAEQWPSTFPSGQGSDLAGVVVAVGEGVATLAPDAEVLGWTDDRASHAELVVVPEAQLVPKPHALSWEVAGSMFVAPLAAYASVQATAPKLGETVVVSGAAGGVGTVAVQLARRTGATVIGLAGEANHEWLRSKGVIPVVYGEGQRERIYDHTAGVDAFIDLFGGGYADLAIALDVRAERINTIIDFAAVGRLGISAKGSSQVEQPQEAVRELADLAAAGLLDIPIAATYALDDVRAAYRRLADRHTRGKIVLLA